MKIKILHCLQCVGSGGVEQRRLLLAKYLDPKKFEQKIVCTHTIGPLADKLRQLGVEVIPIGEFNSPFKIGYYRKVMKVIRQFRPHIIHGAVFEGVTLATVSGFIARVPIIAAEETSDPQNRRWKGNLLFKVLTKLADYVIGVSPAVIDYFRSVGIADRKIRLIINGVDIPADQDESAIRATKDSLNIKDGDFVVGSVGRLRDFHKRFSDLIIATSLLRATIPNIKLLIVGDGEDTQRLKQLAEEKGVSDCVVFAGYQYNPAPYYSCMDIFALASHMEAFGLVLAEAMFFRLPVVASNVGGIRTIVVPEVTGYLVPRHQPQAFADAILKLFMDEKLRVQMGEKGYMRALSEYSADAYVSKVQQFYFDAFNKYKQRDS